MRDLKKEIFKVVFLDAQNQIITIEDLFAGTVDASSVYPREIMERALQLKAVGVVCVHNHPTGNPGPSDNDCQVTMYMVATGRLLGIRVMDHVIIGDNAYYSFADQGLITQYERKSEIRF
jgi:DNA repair protein RadC